MTLDYTLNPGWMAPFVDGLKAGQAMARCCEGCHATSFPPLRSCECGAVDGSWVTLSGSADILYRTTGADGEFGLVHFDGATTKTTVRLVDMAADDTRGWLLASEGNLPALQLTSKGRGTP